MKNILRSGAVLAMVLGLTGCGGEGGEAVSAMKKLKNEMCACKDAACAKEVGGKLAELGKKYAKAKGTESQKKELVSIGAEMQKCAMKAASGGGDAPAPE